MNCNVTSYEVLPELAEKKYLSRDDLYRKKLTGKCILLPEVCLLGDKALFWNQDVTAISAPKAWYMKSGAFSNCKDLIHVNLPLVERAEDRAFENCELLQQINLPAARSIGDYAFRKCSSLEKVELPNVQVMGDDLFDGCYFLKTLYLPRLEYLDTSLRKSPSLESVEFQSLRRITADAFSKCYNLEEIVLHMPYVCPMDPSGFKDAGRITDGTGLIYVPSALVPDYRRAPGWRNYAPQIQPIPDERYIMEAPSSFEPVPQDNPTHANLSASVSGTPSSCELLSQDSPETELSPQYSFQVPAGFERVPVLKKDELGKPLPFSCILLPGTTMLAERAFSDSDLTAFSGPNVRIVNSRAFSNCNDLLYVHLPQAERICSYAFENCLQLTDLSLPNAQMLEVRAFNGCNSLRSLHLPAVRHMDSYVFNECYSLKKLVLQSAELIENALRGLESLETLELYKVKKLSGLEFYDCFFLRELILKTSYVCPLEKGAFYGTNGITLGRAKIMVPYQLLRDYQNAPGWRNYAPQIVALPVERP